MPAISVPRRNDLRARLLKHGGEVIEHTGYEDLDLRQLAALAGVSRGAPYRHFENRKAFLVAMGIAGFRELESEFARIAAGPGTPGERLTSVVYQYLAFAAARPQLFRLMFVSQIHRKDGEPPEWTEAGTAPFRHLERMMGEAMPGADADAVRTATLALWTAKHGFALLSMSGRLRHLLRPGQGEDDVLRESLRRHIP